MVLMRILATFAAHRNHEAIGIQVLCNADTELRLWRLPAAHTPGDRMFVKRIKIRHRKSGPAPTGVIRTRLFRA